MVGHTMIIKTKEGCLIYSRSNHCKITSEIPSYGPLNNGIQPESELGSNGFLSICPKP